MFAGVASAATPVETTVRNAYSKLSYAVDIDTVYQVASHGKDPTATDLADSLAKHALKFQLSNFNEGQIHDISEQNFLRLFPQHAPDNNEVIQTQLKTHKYNEANLPAASMDTIVAKWGPAASWHGDNNVLADYTVREWIPILQAELGVPHLVSYCTYTVTVSFEGKSRTYPAAAFFDKDGNAAIDDTVAGGNGNLLQYFLQHPIYPQILVGPNTISAKPAVRNFLEANQKSAASCKSGDACCDAEAMQCGVFSADIRREP